MREEDQLVLPDECEDLVEASLHIRDVVEVDDQRTLEDFAEGMQAPLVVLRSRYMKASVCFSASPDSMGVIVRLYRDGVEVDRVLIGEVDKEDL